MNKPRNYNDATFEDGVDDCLDHPSNRRPRTSPTLIEDGVGGYLNPSFGTRRGPTLIED